MSIDLKNNVWGSIRTAWQSFARIPVASLPPVVEGETAAKRDTEEPHGKKKKKKNLHVYVCKKCVSATGLGACMLTSPLWFIWCLVLIPSPLITLP